MNDTRDFASAASMEAEHGDEGLVRQLVEASIPGGPCGRRFVDLLHDHELFEFIDEFD